jgi:hypothetical protein
MAVSACGCTSSAAVCSEGQALAMEVQRLYQQFADSSFARQSVAWREAWWCEYEAVRQAYFVHIGLREVTTESEVA